MPLEFIPNQPFIFQNPIGDQPCLNNDPKQYRQLIEPNDKICVQWKMLPCTADVMCEPEMVDIGGDELGAWTTSGGWSSSGSNNATFDGSGGVVGSCEQTLAGLTVGVPYRFNFSVSGLLGAAKFNPVFGLQVGDLIEANGQYSVYFIATTTNPQVSFLMDSGADNPGDEVSITNISVVPMSTCWFDDLNFAAPSWSYSFDGTNGKFCAVDVTGGYLVNTNAYLTDGNYHKVQLVISDCNAGGLVVILGGTTIGTTSGNGLFVFYGTPSGGNYLAFQKVDDFDGCVSSVNVDDYGDVTTDYKVYLTGTATSDEFVPDVFEDRLVFCEATGAFSSETFEWECGAYRLNIDDTCSSTTYTSVNELSYDPTGWDCTKVVEAWNDGTAFGFYFGAIAAPDFTLIQRLRVLQFNPKYPNNSEEYLYSNGSRTRTYAQASKLRTCHFDYVDEYAHDCIRLQLLSSKLLIDNYGFYFPNSDYEPEWGENGRYNLAQSKVELEHETTLFSTTCGTTGLALCPPIAGGGSYTELNVNATIDMSTFDLTSIGYYAFSQDVNGTYSILDNGVSYNFTTIAGRGQFLSDILTSINSFYGCNALGNINLSGSDLTININDTGSWSIPQNAYIFNLIDQTTNVNFPLTVIFS